MQTKKTPASDKPSSYIDLVDQYPDHFFTSDLKILKGLRYHIALQEREQITRLEWQEQLLIIDEPETYKAKDRWRLPSLVEITSYYVNLPDGYHGLTNTRLATTTNAYDKKRVQLLLTRDEYLDLRVQPEMTTFVQLTREVLE